MHQEVSPYGPLSIKMAPRIPVFTPQNGHKQTRSKNTRTPIVPIAFFNTALKQFILVEKLKWYGISQDTLQNLKVGVFQVWHVKESIKSSIF
jgi:hypothetical protein